MKVLEKLFLSLLVASIGFGVLEGYKFFLGCLHHRWWIILIIDLVFFGAMALYQRQSKGIFGILATISGFLLGISLLESTWNLFLLVPVGWLLLTKK